MAEFLKAGSYEKNSCKATVSNYCLGNSFCFPTPKNLLTSRPQAGKLLKVVGKVFVDSQCKFVRSVFSFDVNDLQQLEMLPSPAEHSTNVAFE